MKDVTPDDRTAIVRWRDFAPMLQHVRRGLWETLARRLARCRQPRSVGWSTAAIIPIASVR